MDPTTVALAIAGAFNLLLAALLVLRGSRTPTVLAYAGAVAAAVLWIAAILVLRLASTPALQFGALATGYAAAVAIAGAFWYFTAFFSGRPIRILHHVLVGGGGLFVAGLAILSPAFIQGIGRAPGGALHLTLGPAHWIFASYFVGTMALAFGRLWRRYRTSAGAERSQVASILLGTFLSSLVGATFNLAFVAAGNARYIGWGPVATMIMVAFVGYAIIRQHLLSVRLIGAELFTALLLVTLFAQVLLAPSLLAQSVTVATLGIAAGFGILLIRSVRREVKAREILAQANAELRRLDAAKSEFISLASHQLRSPLAAIEGYTSLLLDGSYGQDPARAREALGRIRSSVAQLAGFVAELLDLSRIEAGRIQYRIQPIRLGEIVERVLRELEVRASAKGVALRFDNRTAAGLRAQADPDKLHEVVMNLVDNAIAYTPKGSVIVTLSAVSDLRQVLRLEVRDEGIGIPPEVLPRLFVKFSRSDEAKKVRPDGTGLGLYLVKRLVEDQGGRVWAESSGPGKGSAFFVELPVSVAAEPAPARAAYPA